ncbi:MAG: hypothetical protein ABSG16_11170 [Candidatus Acidiferrum sp.]
MADSVLKRVSAVNQRVSALLNEARLALRGECTFSVTQVRALSAQLTEMAPVCADAPNLRVMRPELEDELDLYKSQLDHLNTTLQQVHVMLLAQRANMEAHRAQLVAVGHWADAVQGTR